MLSKKDLMTLPDAPLEKLELPEWGEGQHVYVKSMTTSELLRLERQHGKADQAEKFNAALFQLTICDDKGRRVFDSDDEAAVLMQLPHQIVKRIQEGCMVANGLSGLEKKD